jgi:uncharacterized RDD family membrane protein YckC
MLWYYVKDGARQGPVEEAELGRLVGQAVVRPDTLVWCEGMPDWRPYSTVAPGGAALYSGAPIVTPAAAPEIAPVQMRVEPAPEPVVAAAPMTAVTDAPVQRTPDAAFATGAAHYCSQCGRQYPSEELVRFGAATVCANCKDAYAQRLRETGQVAGARVYGGFWIRFLAVFIDGIALWIVNFAIQTVTSTRINPGDVGNLALVMSTFGINFLISIGLQCLYESFFIVRFGATPGKMIFKLKVITPDGGPISWGRAVARYFAKILSGITLMIGYIMAAFDPEKRALHDYIVGTRVIRTA